MSASWSVPVSARAQAIDLHPQAGYLAAQELGLSSQGDQGVSGGAPGVA